MTEDATLIMHLNFQLLTMEIQHGVIAEVTVDSDVHLSITSAICNTLQGN